MVVVVVVRYSGDLTSTSPPAGDELGISVFIN